MKSLRQIQAYLTPSDVRALEALTMPGARPPPARTTPWTPIYTAVLDKEKNEITDRASGLLCTPLCGSLHIDLLVLERVLERHPWASFCYWFKSRFHSSAHLLNRPLFLEQQTIHALSDLSITYVTEPLPAVHVTFPGQASFFVFYIYGATREVVDPATSMLLVEKLQPDSENARLRTAVETALQRRPLVVAHPTPWRFASYCIPDYNFVVPMDKVDLQAYPWFLPLAHMEKKASQDLPQYQVVWRNFHQSGNPPYLALIPIDSTQPPLSFHLFGKKVTDWSDDGRALLFSLVLDEQVWIDLQDKLFEANLMGLFIEPESPSAAQNESLAQGWDHSSGSDSDASSKGGKHSRDADESVEPSKRRKILPSSDSEDEEDVPRPSAPSEDKEEKHSTDSEEEDTPRASTKKRTPSNSEEASGSEDKEEKHSTDSEEEDAPRPSTKKRAPSDSEEASGSEGPPNKVTNDSDEDMQDDNQSSDSQEHRTATSSKDSSDSEEASGSEDKEKKHSTDSEEHRMASGSSDSEEEPSSSYLRKTISLSSSSEDEMSPPDSSAKRSHHQNLSENQAPLKKPELSTSEMEEGEISPSDDEPSQQPKKKPGPVAHADADVADADADTPDASDLEDSEPDLH